MAAVYVGFAVAWVVEIARLRLTAHLRQHVLPVHYLCLAVILVKMIDALVRATYFHRQVRARKLNLEVCFLRIRRPGKTSRCTSELWILPLLAFLGNHEACAVVGSWGNVC